MKKFICTAAIDYANGSLHIGHAYEKMAADTLCRYHSLRGQDATLVIGADEHGQKVARTAAAHNLPPQAYVDNISADFLNFWQLLNVDSTHFVRTTSPLHAHSITAFLARIRQFTPDAFYEKTYTSKYCVGCEAYLEESAASCPLHPTIPLEIINERNWFFKLSSFQERLQKHFSTNPAWLLPASRRQEIWSLLKSPLPDVAISRDATRVPWGLPFTPTSDGSPQTLYVWLDALPSYLTALGFPDNLAWPADLQIIGKDITRFHALLWPALLWAADLPLPKKIWAHGFVEIGGQRASKSAPISLDLPALINSVGPDAFRFLLLKEVPFDADGTITLDRLQVAYTSELAHGFGNLTNRILALITKLFQGQIPTDSSALQDTRDHILLRQKYLAEYHQAMSNCLLHVALASLQSLVSATNQYLQATKPWSAALPIQTEVLHQASLTLATLCHAYAPFLPKTTDVLWTALGSSVPMVWPVPEMTGWHVSALAPLFPAVSVAGWPLPEPPASAVI